MKAYLYVLLMALAVCCTSRHTDKRFVIRRAADTGIDFKNNIVTNDTLNALTFEYIYNGAGVGVGDFNNDGLEDIFFAGNQVSSKLYLNEGNLRFRDITKEAGVSTTRWVTGVSVADINQDGLLDVFLAVAGQAPNDPRDLLFINQGMNDGVPSFVESAHDYGIDDDGYGTMGAFLDYDRDGDLDLYILTNALEKFNRNNLRPKRVNGEAASTDRLYRNNGNNTFTNVSREAGILIEGYGLGVAVSDINLDGWPDIYASNDFMSNDLVWINQQNGTFKNMAGEYLKHQTHNGMGVDIADFNNDALADIIEVDMLPPGHKRQKMMTPGQNYDHFHMSMNMGYQPQYLRNTLQLNRGSSADGTMHFSEIAFQAGVSATDWSWAPLFADFDNDGWKDLFIGNGYRKDVTHLDFIFFGTQANSPFGTPEARSKKLNQELSKLEDVNIVSYFFRNTGKLAFEDVTEKWGVDVSSFSNGCAYADFDSDGDLDLITNNIDQEIMLYENKTDASADPHHYLKLQSADPGVYHQKIWVYTGGQVQYQELVPFRGFQSTVSQQVFFGLGDRTTVDSVRITWPDGHTLKYMQVPADTLLRFSRAAAVPGAPKSAKPSPYFEPVAPVQLVHAERSPSDIKVTRTLLHELSRYGPCLAAADVNGDNLDDFFVGAERGDVSRLFIQKSDGTFQVQALTVDTVREDGDGHFFDADKDGDTDLYVAACSPYSGEAAAAHALYLNDGNGVMTLAPAALPVITTSASCVASADYDGDGDLDLFVGGRIKPNAYPNAPRSYVLRNDGGKLTDVTRSLNVALEYPGVVSAGIWVDVNRDNRPDLVVAGEWMPIRVFINNGTTLLEETQAYGLENSHGWWSALEAADLNGDGFPEIVAGNTGRNSFFQPTLEQPVMITAGDIDKNGSIDPIVTYYNPVEKDRFVVHNRLVAIDQVPGLKRRFETFEQYASTPFSKAFKEKELEGAFTGKASTLTSVLLSNELGKRFTAIPLPDHAQVSTINDVAVDDVNSDGHADLVLVGNSYSQETLFGRYDASPGVVLLGDGRLGWHSLEPGESGWLTDGDAKAVKKVRTAAGTVFVVGNSNGALQFFLLKKQPHGVVASKK